MFMALLCLSSPAFADALEGRKAPAEILAETPPSEWRAFDQENLLYITLGDGVAIVALSEFLAQDHVAQLKSLARQGFYDGLSFYRVIDGFVAQGGDPFEERDIGDAKQMLKAEFEEPLPEFIERVGDSFATVRDSDGYASRVGFVDGLPVGVDDQSQTVWHLHCAGAFAFGREIEKNSASTEIYITLQPQRYLDRNLSVVGRVISGMEHIQRLNRNTPPEAKTDALGDVIVSMRIGADLPADQQLEFETLRAKSDAFTEFWEARRNRPEAFFYVRHDHLDICQFPVPIREVRRAETEQ